MEIPQEIEKVITGELTNLTADVGEIILDSMMKDGVIKEIPVLGSVVSMLKTGIGVHNYLFVLKLIKFLNAPRDLKADERLKMINEINEDPKYKIKVGSQLMLMLDKADDLEKATIIGNLFSAFVKQNITWDEFNLYSNVVNRAHLSTLVRLSKSGAYGSDEYRNELVALGLVNMKIGTDNSKAQASLTYSAKIDLKIHYEENNIAHGIKQYGLLN